ncbi:BON domain-containing protein [uncultured Desulfobacter sp.]|uniref:BON domain-containing protein n=1 Tax=uncultured Desulfobacter sp. TaxID=240139 RepID=UPI002AABF3DF|nr:BON domain-containing protein [uncultured Desulfobacter sp.]
MKKPVYRLAVLAAVAAMLFTTIPLFASDTDDRIEASAPKTYVFKTYLKDDNIKIKSKNGLVTLTGTVQDPSHKSLAEETIAGLPGVKGVDNKLEEKDKNSPAEKSDAWLIAKVKTALLFHRHVSGTGTEVLADNGTISLRGKAESLAQKDLTTEYAMDVEGVENVKNEMTVPDAGNETSGIKKKVVDKTNRVVESIDDASITALVKTSLLYHRSTSAINTKVETKNSVVTLEGMAKTSAEKDLAGKYASDVNGVKDVNNNITVE